MRAGSAVFGTTFFLGPDRLVRDAAAATTAAARPANRADCFGADSINTEFVGFREPAATAR